MAQMPTYENWIRSTHSKLHKRSEWLKALDATIKERKPKEDVKKALDRWRFEHSKQGKDWRKSVRNKKGAVTELYRAVNDLDKRALSEEEREAMRYIRRAQMLALAKQFDGKKLTFKKTTLVGFAQGAGSKFAQFKTASMTVAQGAKTGHGIGKNVGNIMDGAKLLNQGGRLAAQNAAGGDLSGKITKLCKTLCPNMDADKVFQHLNLGNVSQFANNVAPFVGAISSGGKAVKGWIGVAQTAYKKHSVGTKRYAFAAGDPEAAFDAVLVLLKRDMASQAGRASSATVVFTGKLLGSFLDAGAVSGPVMGILETLADILQTVVEYVRDYKEVERANALLAVGYLNLELFEESPIIGCYFLLVQDHSTIINFAVADYGTPNWVFDAERLVAAINPVLDQARKYVHASRFEIAEFQKHKGIMEANYSVATGLGKVTGLPGAVKDKVVKKLEDWFLKPERPAKPPKKNIEGMGPRGYGY